MVWRVDVAGMVGVVENVVLDADDTAVIDSEGAVLGVVSDRIVMNVETAAGHLNRDVTPGARIQVEVVDQVVLKRDERTLWIVAADTRAAGADRYPPAFA